jgi:hypothetical protein
MLETMERNAERMQHLIGEVLDLARYRAGTIGLQLRQFDATELAESSVSTIRPLAERKNQTVKLHIPRGPAPRVFGDRPRLDRALLNLVANDPVSPLQTRSTCSSGSLSGVMTRSVHGKASGSGSQELSRSPRRMAARSKSGVGRAAEAHSPWPFRRPGRLGARDADPRRR